MQRSTAARPLPDPAPVPGRAFVVENWAPLGALRLRAEERESAWHAPDDRAPGRAMWDLWSRHVALRLVARVRRRRAPDTRVVRPLGGPVSPTGSLSDPLADPLADPLTDSVADDEKASGC